MSRGRHRRPRIQINSRQLSRLSAVLVAGGALAAPLAAAGTAQAAPQGAQHAAAAGTVKTSAKAEQQAAETYTVASGDTLFRIAEAHEVDGGWQSLYKANKETVGDNPDLIFPGQELTLEAAPAPKKQGGDEQSSASTASADQASYPDNLDGWIREALSIMQENGIPGTYEGIHRNIMRESSGDPSAINNWDINAQNGTPSIGLLQVIKPTFDAYHVDGTAWDQYDPVANIVAACNYAADRYGSIDNVNGPY
ncbi:LysM peptidoglycan-binding domain-containing protein [Streptomyces sp. TR06-5]|uniref:transglycosylase SLT domain-containing protein n=1 Tax=unclassified Streptomyces TaxID=2593676 RepID=UPI0039A02E4D